MTRGRTRFDTFAKHIATNTIISTATATISSTTNIFASYGLSVQVLGLARIFQQMTFDSCNMMTLVAKDKKLTRVNTARARFSLSLFLLTSNYLCLGHETVHPHCITRLHVSSSGEPEAGLVDQAAVFSAPPLLTLGDSGLERVVEGAWQTGLWKWAGKTETGGCVVAPPLLPMLRLFGGRCHQHRPTGEVVSTWRRPSTTSGLESTRHHQHP